MDKSMYCTFHKKYGHTTDDCAIAKALLEKLARQGMLDKYIDSRGQRRNTEDLGQHSKSTDNHRDKGKKVDDNPNPPHQIINCISGGFASGGSTNLARKISYRTMMSVTNSDPTYTTHTDAPDVTFSSSDYQASDKNSNDPVVISLQVGEPLVKKVLMDPGSSADVVFYSTYQKMKLSDKTLQPSSGEMVDFSGERIPILGYI
ncbi:uncharacterized protein [Arachis hypogaea]|uniref:uncharacterized protein n=1 Tax=Arachis hypogaea TaxID=3818 RepID=UPI003B21A478